MYSTWYDTYHSSRCFLQKTLSHSQQQYDLKPPIRSCSVLASQMEANKLSWVALGDNSQCLPNGNFWPRIMIRACFRLEVHWSRTKSTDYSNCSLLFKRSLFSSIVHITKRCINLPFQTQTKMGKKRKISRRKKSFFLWKVNLKRVKTLKKKSSVVFTVY